MYLSVRDQPHSAGPGLRGRSRFRPGRVVLVLGTVSLLTDISSESVAAILPLYLTVVIGLSPVAYGVVDGLYQGVSALARLSGGWLADRTDRPKWVAFAGYGLSAVARVFLLLASGVAGVAAVVTADRIGKGLRTAPRDAMISAATPTEFLGRAFGVHRAMDTVGAALGPLIAFALLWAVPDGYTTVMVVSLAFAVVGVTVLGLFAPDQRIRQQPGSPATPPFRWHDLTDVRLRPLLLIAGLLGLLTIGDGFIYLALLDSGGFAGTWFPMLYVGTNLAYLALAVPAGQLADRIGRARVLVLGHVALALAYVCTTLPAPAAVTTTVTLLLLGAFYATTDGVIAALAGRLVPVQARSSGIAAAQTVVALARMSASFGFGVLWLLVGPATAMLAVAVALVVAVLLAFGRVDRLDRSMMST